MKTRKTAILLCLILCFTALFPIASAAGEDAATQSVVLKDGIRAKLSATSENEKVVANISIENKGCEYLGNIKCKLLLPDGIMASATDFSINYVIAVGDKWDFNAVIEKSELKAPDIDTEQKSDGIYIVMAVSIACLIVAVIVFVCIRKKKNNVAMLLIGSILLPYFAFSTNGTADAATRYITLSENVIIGDETYRIEAEIEYEYNFKEENVAKTSGMNGFQITYFYGPPGYGKYPVDEELIKAIADCGFTSIPLAAGEDEAKRILDIMDDYGLTCSALYSGAITDQLIYFGDPDVSQEEVDAIVQSVVDTYEGYDNILGWNLYDEPTADKFPVIQKIVSAFRRIDPERETHLNVWPNYASAEALKATDYNSYLERFMSEVDPDYLSFDYYHFTSETTSSDLTRYFENIEDIRSAGLKYGKDQMQILLLTKHLTLADITPYQLQWEVNIALAYGMKRISYFSFWNDQYMEADGCSNSCMNSMGEKNPHYYDVQNVNKWLLPLGNELFGKTSTAVFHKCSPQDLSENSKAYTSYGALGLCTGNNFLIGFFDDASFMIVNKEYYYDKDNTKNVMVFDDVTNGLEYFDTDSASWKNAEESSAVTRNDDGKYVAQFEPGQGILFRVND